MTYDIIIPLLSHFSDSMLGEEHQPLQNEKHIMARRIDSLKHGEVVTLNFHGSKQFGNDAYQLKTTFVGINGAGDRREAVFEDVTAYRFKGYWAYVTSTEKLSISQ